MLPIRPSKSHPWLFRPRLARTEFRPTSRIPWLLFGYSLSAGPVRSASLEPSARLSVGKTQKEPAEFGPTSLCRTQPVFQRAAMVRYCTLTASRGQGPGCQQAAAREGRPWGQPSTTVAVRTSILPTSLPNSTVFFPCLSSCSPFSGTGRPAKNLSRVKL